MKCKRKSPTIEAYVYGVGDSEPEWFKKELLHKRIRVESGGRGCYVYTQNRMEYARCADYIIKDENGNLHVCDPETFEAEYEAVEE